MAQPESKRRPLVVRQDGAPPVRFPLPPNSSGDKKDWMHRRVHFALLLPPRWRRRVVIQGQHYWLPG